MRSPYRTAATAVVVLLALSVSAAASPAVPAARAATLTGESVDGVDQPAGVFDLNTFSLTYDEDAGSLRASYRVVANGYTGEHGLYFRFGLSRIGEGGCAPVPTEPDLDVRSEVEEGGFYVRATFAPPFGVPDTIDGTHPVGDPPGQEWVFTVQSPQLTGIALKGRELRCVSHVFVSQRSPVEAGDSSAGFCLIERCASLLPSSGDAGAPPVTPPALVPPAPGQGVKGKVERRDAAPVRARVLSGARLRSLALNGMAVRVSCPTRCRSSFDLIVSRATAKRLGSSPILVRSPRGGARSLSRIIRGRPARRVARRLLALERLNARLVVRSVDARGVVRRVERRVTVRR